MRWRTRASSVIIKKPVDNIDDDDIVTANITTKPSAYAIKDDLDKKVMSRKSVKPEPTPTGAGFLGALDKVKEPRFLSAKKEKRNNIQLNL
jgi:hypothetical protein